MDTYKEIIKLVSSFNTEVAESITFGILSHIERAEYYFNKALEEKDDQYFTDIIYRCNHAYEGVLKEAYSIFSGKSSKHITPDKIEQYFLDNMIFKERVKNYFSSYRSDWRNPSTHDNKLFFTKEESFMAIVSVSSFIYLLLSQLLESKSYQLIKYSQVNIPTSLFSSDNVLKSIQIFGSYLHENNYTISTEVELLGYLRAYLESIYKDVEILSEYKINSYRIDLAIFVNKKIELIIELKISSIKNYYTALTQVMTYMDSLGCSNSIVYLFDSNNETDYEIETTERIGDAKKVFIIKPKKLTTAST